MNGWKTPPILLNWDMKDHSRCATNQLGQTRNYSIDKHAFSACRVAIPGLSTVINKLSIWGPSAGILCSEVNNLVFMGFSVMPGIHVHSFIQFSH